MQVKVPPAALQRTDFSGQKAHDAHKCVHVALLLSSTFVPVSSADWLVDTCALLRGVCEGCATMCRPGCSGWHPEYGKAWEHWGMPRYTM